MFEQSLLQNAAQRGRKTGSIVISLFGQVLLISGLVISPMIFTEGIPRLRVLATLPPPPMPEVPAEIRHVIHHGGATLNQTESVIRRPIDVPTRVPTVIQDINDLGPGPDAPLLTDIRGVGISGSVPSLQPAMIVERPAPPAAPAPTAPKGPVYISSIENAKILFRPQPIYPQPARQVRVEGTVRLEAVISREGLIENIRILSGHPLLAGAARDAVLQWRYKPTMLNGQAVEVITNIDVTFTLSN